jgi:hypothetical protein
MKRREVTAARLSALIEEATVDAHDESEQTDDDRIEACRRWERGR